MGIQFGFHLDIRGLNHCASLNLCISECDESLHSTWRRKKCLPVLLVCVSGLTQKGIPSARDVPF